MSGDCGHGWGYHASRAEPCGKCKEEYDKLKLWRDNLQSALDLDIAKLPEMKDTAVVKHVEMQVADCQKAMDRISSNW